MSKTILPIVPYLLLTACGGGGSSSGGSIDGLQGPQQVTIVEANGDSVGALRLPAGLRGATGTDYQTDATRYWIEDKSIRPLDTVNMILSSLQQTHYWEQTNAGPYRALIENEEEGGGERGNNGKSYEEWLVDSRRASNSAPQIVSFWIAQQESMGQQVESVIYGKLTVVTEPSDSQPLGEFTLYFKNLPASADASSTDTMFQGYLRTVDRDDGQSELEFFMSHGDVDSTPAPNEFAMRDRVHVVGDPANDTGRAYTESRFVQNDGSNVYSEAGEYQVQFNADYLARRDVANGNTLAVLDRNDFTTRVHRYGVYDATTEARIEQQGGFPIETANGRNGWAGYYGLWLPEDAAPSNGDTVYRRSFSDNTTTPYTVFIAAGRLQKRSRSSITFSDLVDELLQYWDPSTGGELQVIWTGSDLVKVADRSNGEWQPIDPPVSVLSSFTTGQWVGFWSQARGQVEISWPSTPSNSSTANVWSMETITADSSEMADGDLTLYGYFHQLRADITSNQANYQNSETPYFADATTVASGNKTYTFDKETLLLMLGSSAVTLASGVEVTQGPAMFGLNCGPLYATALNDFSEMAQQTVTYQWDTGSNEWNQLRTLLDSNGDFVQFDQPIRMTYVHSEQGSPFDGRTFFLEWDGNNLGGIPYEQDTNSNRWNPLFNLPTGTTIVGGDTTYKIKQLEGEQEMVEVSSPSTVYAAQGFDLDSETLTAPTATPYRDPGIGAKPTVTKAPLYVGGVSQVD